MPQTFAPVKGATIERYAPGEQASGDNDRAEAVRFARTTAIFNRNTEDVMPADLAKHYEIEPPPPGTPKGKALPVAVATPLAGV